MKSPGMSRGAPRRLILRSVTLVELALVVLIIGILAAVATPRIANALVRYRLEAAAKQVANDLNLARQRARQTSQAQRVVFDTATSSYRIVGLPDQDCPTREYRVRLAEPPYEVRIAAVDLGGDAQIVFDGFGTPDSGGTLTLAAGNCACIITVISESGAVFLPGVQFQQLVALPAELPVPKPGR